MSKRRCTWFSPWIVDISTHLFRVCRYDRRAIPQRSIRALVYRRSQMARQEVALFKAATRLSAAHLETMNWIFACNAELARRGHRVMTKEADSVQDDPLAAALKIVASGEDGE